MVKRRYVLMGVAAALIVTAVTGGALAYFQANGTVVAQQINTKHLAISLTDDSSEYTADDIIGLGSAMPGSDIEKNIYVENTADTPLYARVTLRKFWSDDETKDIALDAELIELTASLNWIIMEDADDAERLVLYYTQPLNPGEVTDSVVGQIHISEKAANKYADMNISLEVTADAVQTYAGEDAILSEWGVLAVTAGDGGAILSITD